MKNVTTWIGLILLGLILGVGSAFLAVRQPFDGIRNGSWTASFETGSQSADAWTRARVAVQALLAMTKDQAIYFTAHHDSEGRAFDANCSYTIRGGRFATRWWSVTIYDDEYFLISNPDDRYSITAAGLEVDDAGRWSAGISNDPDADLVAPPAGDFNLILRLYHPDPSTLKNPAAVAAPVITREACG